MSSKKETSRCSAEVFTRLINERKVFLPDQIDEFVKYTGADRAASYKKRNHGEMLNLPCAFDIETTSFYSAPDQKRGTMYIWMLGINGGTMIGRTWPEFVTVLNRVSELLRLTVDRRLIIYVHNLEFEFQFFRKWFSWEKVFALDERRPVYAITTVGIEFRCSYILSGYSLAKLGDMLQRYKVKKRVGDLDYSKKRHSATPVSDTELDYCLDDIRVPMAYIQEKIDNEGNITKLQLTKTGYVRKFCRDMCMYDGGHNHNKKAWKQREYRKLMESLTIDGADEYSQLKRCFQGGFTHTNAYWSGIELHDVDSDDFTSSYPATLLMEKFPMSKAELVDIRSMEQFRDCLLCYCCVFDIEFIGLCARSDANEHPLSVSKCKLRGRWMDDNGRLISADAALTTITDVDFRIIEAYYTWEGINIGTFRRYRRGYLPKDLVLAILDLYEKKTTLKGVAGREEEYLNSKEMLNSVYGMMVTDIVRDVQTYDGENWGTETVDMQKEVEKYNTSMSRFQYYIWGIFCTSWSRYHLFTGIKALGNDFVYADTDSVKYLHREKHLDYFRQYNEDVERKLRRAMAFHKIDFDRCRPKTIKGVEKLIGVWDYEGRYSRFKALRAKCYMTEELIDGKLSLTVSGVNKKVAMPYLIKKYGDPFKAFEDGLVIPPEYTGKMTHTYIDDEYTCSIRDYLGNESEVHEFSSIHLENCEYSLNLTDSYINLLLSLR